MSSLAWIAFGTILSCVVLFTAPQRLKPRIVGGVEVIDRCLAPFNWMAGLRMVTSAGPVTFCSAVMLDNVTLVTAARCIADFVNAGIIIGEAVIGERDLMATESDEQVIALESLRVHPQYNSLSYDNNIGLVRLASPAYFTSCIKPYQRMEDDPDACTDFDTTCLMAGWGSYVDTADATNSRVARSAAMAVFDDFVTLQLELIRTQSAPPVGSVYGETLNPYQKACYFDWGGVVSCQRNGHYVLKGVIGELNCDANPTPPIMVTDVSLYEQWLEACQRDWNSATCTGQITS